MDFQEANAQVHPVETQWHYPILTAAGFIAETKEATGLGRQYLYSKDGNKIRCSTGVSSDHWSDLQTSETGYWSSLEKHLKIHY